MDIPGIYSHGIFHSWNLFLSWNFLFLESYFTEFTCYLELAGAATVVHHKWRVLHHQLDLFVLSFLITKFSKRLFLLKILLYITLKMAPAHRCYMEAKYKSCDHPHLCGCN